MKILFFSEAVSTAHIGRPLILAKESHCNGNEVHFACAAGALEKINSKEISFYTHPLYTITSKLFYERVNHGKFFYTCQELKKYVETEKDLIQKIKPDLIVSDFRLTTAISAVLTNTPLLNLSNAYWSPNYACPFPAPNFGIFNFLSDKTSKIIFNLLRPIAFKTFGKELNLVREFYGLERKSDFRELYTDGTYTAYMDMPNFVTLKNKPSNHFFLGPIVWSPEIEKDNISLKGNNNIYISMGSTGEQDNLPIILNSVLKKGYRLILSGLNATETNSLNQKIPGLKSQSVIRPLINADKILPHCCLTICHGGSGTVYQSLAHGVPVLCFPKNPDQSLVSMVLIEKNLGRNISQKCFSKHNTDIALDDCLSNDFLKNNAYKFALKMKSWDTLLHWNQFLNQFKIGKKIIKDIA